MGLLLKILFWGPDNQHERYLILPSRLHCRVIDPFEVSRTQLCCCYANQQISFRN